MNAFVSHVDWFFFCSVCDPEFSIQSFDWISKDEKIKSWQVQYRPDFYSSFIFVFFALVLHEWCRALAAHKPIRGEAAAAAHKTDRIDVKYNVYLEDRSNAQWFFEEHRIAVAASLLFGFLCARRSLWLPFNQRLTQATSYFSLLQKLYEFPRHRRSGLRRYPSLFLSSPPLSGLRDPPACKHFIFFLFSKSCVKFHSFVYCYNYSMLASERCCVCVIN